MYSVAQSSTSIVIMSKPLTEQAAWRKSYNSEEISFSFIKSKPDTIRIHRAIDIVWVTATKVASESITLKHQRGGRIFFFVQNPAAGYIAPIKMRLCRVKSRSSRTIALQDLGAFEHRRDRIFARLRDLRFKIVQVITSRETIRFFTEISGAGHEQAQIGPAFVETVADPLARFDHLFGSGGLTLASVPAERKDQRDSDNDV